MVDKKNNIYKKLFFTGMFIAIPIYIFCVLIPIYYEYNTKLPDTDKTLTSVGYISKKEITPKKGYMIELNNDGQSNLYTCSNGFFGEHHSCLPINIINEILGKKAEIKFFVQKIYPTVQQNRLLELHVNGKELIGYQDTKNKIEKNRNVPVFFGIGILVFYIFIILTLRRSNKGDKQ